MPEPSTPQCDDALTIASISILAFMLADVLHEGVGHALIALLTGTPSGVLSTVAWSSAFDSRLVAAGGTLVNLAVGLILWFSLRLTSRASPQMRLFLLLSCAFNLFTGTGYFFFSGVTDFGDWAQVIAGLHAHWLWRTILIVAGITAYYAVVLVIGSAVVRCMAVPRTDRRRLRKLMFTPYFSAIAISVAGGLFNPVGIALLWQSALAATAGGNSGLLWLQYYIPKGARPEREPESLDRSYSWIGMAAVAGLVFVLILGRGIRLHR